MNTISNNNITFGWHHKMHSSFVEGALNCIGSNKGNLRILSEAVQKPDLEEFFLYGQNHFYYPDSRIKSYLDLLGIHNAKSKYIEHIKKMQEILLNSAEENGLDKAGRALHYLQDMSQPNHIDKGTILKKALNARSHCAFEMEALDKTDFFIKASKPKSFNSSDFVELFFDTVERSKENLVPKNSNANQWSEIIQTGTDIALGATVRFLELLKKI